MMAVASGSDSVACPFGVVRNVAVGPPWSVSCTCPIWVEGRLCNGEGNLLWDGLISSVRKQLLPSRSPYEQRCVW